MFVSPLQYLYYLNFDDRFLGSTNKLNVVHPQKYLQISMLHTCNEVDTMCSVVITSLQRRSQNAVSFVMMVYVLSYWNSCKWYIIAQMITDLFYFVTLKLLLNIRLFMSHLIIQKWLWTPSHMPEYILLHFSEQKFSAPNVTSTYIKTTKHQSVISFKSLLVWNKQTNVPKIAQLGRCPNFMERPMCKNYCVVKK